MRQDVLKNGLYDPRFEHDNCGIGAVVVVVADVLLELPDELLGLGGGGIAGTEGTQTAENVHQAVGIGNLLALGLLLLLGLPPGIGVAPAFLGLGGVGVQLFGIIGFEIHVHHSCFLDLTGVVDEPVQMLPPQLQKADLVVQGGHGVEIWCLQQVPDLLQGKLKLPEQKDRLKPSQGGIVIEPVSGFGHLRGL